MKSFMRGASLLLLAISSSVVIAIPITGNIAFTGLATVTGTTLTFNSTTTTTVAFVDGNFADEGVSSGDIVAFNSFDYSSPFSVVSPLWTIAGFSFDLETVTVGPTGSGVDLALSGTGTLMNAGYDNTVYNWAYGGNAIVGTLQVFSSASAPTAVPEPGSLTLLGLGLVGFAVTGYRRRHTQV